MPKAHLILEVTLATTLTLIVTFLIGFIPAKDEFIKPVRQGFLDFDIYDLYYAGRHSSTPQRDSNIVLVCIENDRQCIADQISLISRYSPAVIGIDAVFDNAGSKPDERRKDIALVNAISAGNKVVVASQYVYDEKGDKASISGNFFSAIGSYTSGYINFIGDSFAVIRNYPPFLIVGDSLWAFAAVVARKFSQEKFDQLVARKHRLETINYSGNLERYTCITSSELKAWDSTAQLQGILPNKIVLLGYFVKDDRPILEDLHFTPLNQRAAGKSYPDMYGVVIHANILSMILGGNYVNRAPDYLSYVSAGAIVFLFLYFVLLRHKKSDHPGHGWFHLIQLLLTLGVLYLFLLVFSCFHIKFTLTPIIISLVLAMEMMSVYKLLAIWLSRRFHFKTVFDHKHSL
ncbi:MAG TPA: CHASE2 domain-containing protein [Puia sp.]|uniref:CHASE2 domain-containing protein n=1 Tax=Puia sp. TaxID=2045100 RepID=UPI002CAEBAAF|nr:CHASE2 domain-containing protein [Puia sp.]HVU95450.1 CHASE2 domain-containing protein [Puia sp.]